MAGILLLLVFPLCLTLAGLTDLLEMKIPNFIPIVLSLSFLLGAPFMGLSLLGFGLHLAAGVIVFMVCFMLFAINVMGGGDAKILTAAALWFGFGTPLMAFLVYVSLFGGLLTILILVLRAHANNVLAIGLSLPASLVEAKKIPYGIAIAFAGIISYPLSPIFLQLTSNFI